MIEHEKEYRGLKIRAASNLHDDCFSLIEKFDLPGKAVVLDLGAGEGAFTKRLMDRGFEVQAVEHEVGRFQAGARCYNLDLNLDFGKEWEGRFDLVVAIEIIEHLQNPRHFIKNCLQVLKPRRYLLITSPNLESWVSRIRFFRSGRFLWFDEEEYSSIGHITPIFSWQMRQICEELNADLVQMSSTKNRFLWRRLGNTIVKIIKSKALYMGLLYPIMKNWKDGEINIYVIRK